MWLPIGKTPAMPEIDVPHGTRLSQIREISWEAEPIVRSKIDGLPR